MKKNSKFRKELSPRFPDLLPAIERSVLYKSHIPETLIFFPPSRPYSQSPEASSTSSAAPSHILAAQPPAKA
ncbi:hypothetical protein M5K25_011731 [Dendrobium thyrsiflorum]|uniref:Uncharacterized protein n=1 Tax=Dendrobium thyrsiflorum TaxID=117978 RepID=A0ABD0V3I2_DENTH